MTNVFVDYCVDLGSTDLTSSLLSKTVVGSKFLDYSSDPFLEILQYVPDVNVQRSRNDLRLVGSSIKTRIKKNPSYFDNLRFFFEVLQNQAVPARGSGNWTPRYSTAVGGVKLQNSVAARTMLSQFFPTNESHVGDKNFDDFFFTLLATPLGDRVASVNAFEFMQSVFAQSSTVSFKRDGTVDYHECEIKLTGISEDLLMYHVDCHGFWKLNHSLYFGTMSYDVSISLSRTDPGLTLLIENSRDWRMLTNGSLVRDVTIFDGVYRQRLIRHKAQTGQLAHAIAATDWSITACHGALYHSQSGALAVLMGDVSKQFETLIESPGFLKEVLPAAAELPGQLLGAGTGTKALSADALFLGNHAPPTGYFSRLRSLLRLLAGGYLAFIFAVRPTIAGAADVLRSHLPNLTLFKASKGLVFNSDTDFFDLPPGLKELVSQITQVDLIHWHISFRTEVSLSLRNHDVVDTIERLLQPPLAAGLFPEPKVIWSMGTFTFVIDWVLPISRLIEDAQTFFSSMRLRRSRIGHSVNVKVTDASGLTYEIYIRSDETFLFVDPPRDSWLQTQGVQFDAALALSLTLLL
jgi:hypothetical protein